jgi:hypothetical protein
VTTTKTETPAEGPNPAPGPDGRANRGGRAVQVLLAVALVAAGGWAAWHFGPKPARSAGAAQASAAPVEQAHALGQPQPAAGPGTGGLPGAGGTFGLLGQGPSVVDSGHVGMTADAFLGSLERAYRERGFKLLDEALATSMPIDLEDIGAKKIDPKKIDVKKLDPEAVPKFYWRAESPLPMIVGLGVDADPRPGAHVAEPGLFMTIASPARDGTEWTTYRYESTNMDALARLNVEDPTVDLPGEDPPAIPRAPGSRRLFSLSRPGPSGTVITSIYHVRAPVEQVRGFYTHEMARLAWRLDTYATREAAKIARGVLCFTQGQQACTLWIDQKTPDAVSVVVNYR